MANYKKKLGWITLCFLSFLGSPVFAQVNTPVIYTQNPVYVQQGQSATFTITGENLNSRSVIGVTGGDVYAFILKDDSQGTTLTAKVEVNLTASLGEREFFLENIDGARATLPIVIQPPNPPEIEKVISNTSPTAGSSPILTIIGMGFFNVVMVSASNDKFLINSYQASSDGNFITVSTALAPDIIPASVYTIYVTTTGGEAQGDLIDLNSFNVDPYSPGIYSVEINSSNRNQIVLKGSMFDPDPSKNTVTLLENNDGNVISRQVEVVYSNSGELVVSLPQSISKNLDTVSFAVSNTEGKSSNIKTVNLDSLYSTSNEPTSSPSMGNQVAVNNSQTSVDISSTNITTLSQNPQVVSSPNVIAENNLSSQKVEKPLEKPVEKLQEETSVAQNIQNLSKYLFTSTQVEIVPSQISEIKDPQKVISAIEENKQLKNQADLIMLALDEAKENQELSLAAKKAELLKNKVEELEKLLTAEKQKNNPNQRKLAKYTELLNNANAESRSQTFELLNNLLAYKPQLKNLLIQKPFDLATVQPNIPPDSIILQYVPTEEGLIIFTVDNKNLKTRVNKNISKEILSKEVQAYRQLFEKEIEKIKLTGRVTPIINWKDDKSNTYKKEILPLKEKNVFLYSALIEPIEKDIADKKVIAVIANGWLRYLPFQSLGKLTKDGDIKFLISDKSVVYLDSVVAVSKNLPQALSSMAAITVFANPDGTLSGADKEAEIISMLFGKTTTALVQKPFDIPIINQLAKKADILHLATHGYLDGTDINSSYLISGKSFLGKKLAPEKLFLKDIYDLNLTNNKLVVLSGCDTGKLGSLSNEPDDIVGSLATAFRIAGANTILASLWKAHDEATKIIMQNFYENIKSGFDKAEALRRAELKVKENPQYGHPLFWSLFSLIGDWR